MCMRVCLCLCQREGEGKREREREGGTARNWIKVERNVRMYIHYNVPFYTSLIVCEGVGAIHKCDSFMHSYTRAVLDPSYNA